VPSKEEAVGDHPPEFSVQVTPITARINNAKDKIINTSKIRCKFVAAGKSMLQMDHSYDSREKNSHYRGE